MRKTIGLCISIIGASLWEKGGWTGDEQYKDLKWFGKIGYHLVCTGFKIAGITMEDLEKIHSTTN